MEDDSSIETTVRDAGVVTVPLAVRERLEIDPGDEIRWTLEGESVRVEPVEEAFDAFDDLEPTDE